MIRKMLHIQERLWAEVNLDNVAHNFKLIRETVGNDTSICCTIKANAYGHGAVPLARLYEELGADWFAVSGLEEAVELRQAGIKLPILVLGYSPVKCAIDLAFFDVAQSVFSLEYARELSHYATEAGVTVKAHIKIDSGMGRIGFAAKGSCADEELSAAYEAATLPGIQTEGIFTHFCVADGGDGGKIYTNGQFDAFLSAIKCLEERGLSFKYRHCANSATIFDYPEFRLDMVRAGIVLYGLDPSSDLRNKPELKTTVTLRSIISHIKTVEKGDSIGYGRTYIADKPRRIATVPIGYADGLFRSGSNGRIAFTVAGKAAPVVGRICMDQTMIDVTDIPEAAAFYPVTVFGDGAVMSAEDIARANGTIGYEILTNISRRVPRVYIRRGESIEVEDSLIHDFREEEGIRI